MANVKPEQVFVVGVNGAGTQTLSQISATASGGTNFTTAFNLPALVGSLYAFDENGVAVNTANPVPERIQFAIGDGVRTLRLSDYIRVNKIERYSRTQFIAKTPLVWTIDLNQLTLFNTAGTTSNSITLMISYRKTSMDFCMQKIQVTLKDLGSVAANAVELARLINESVTQQLVQSAWKPISAYVDTGTNIVYVHETQMPADFSGINTPNQFIFDLSESSSYENGTGIQDDYWTQLQPTNPALVRNYYLLATPAQTYPDYLVYNQAGNYWALATTPSTPFVLVTPTPISGTVYPTNLTGDGFPVLVKSHLRESDWGYAGVQNRTHYADTGYDTVDSRAVYDAHIIDYSEDSMVEMGGSTSRRKAKRLIIYIPISIDAATALAGNTSANFESFMTALKADNFF